MAIRQLPLKRLLLRRAAVQKQPLSGTFELTPRCNLNCSMCYVRMEPAQMAARGRERSASEWIALGREAAEAGTLFLLLTGGEPLLRPDFGEIYRALSGMGLSLSVNTNGTLAKQAHLELFRELPPAAVNLTLYGASPETYGQLCGRKEAYHRAVETVEALRELGVPLRLNYTLTRENAGDLEALADFAGARGLQLRTVTYLFPPVRRGGPAFARLSPEEAGALSARAQWLTEDPAVMRRRAEELAENLPCRTPPEDCQWESREGLHCLAANSQYWVAWNGEMYPCGMLPEPVVRPFEDGFSAAWRALTELAAHYPHAAACEDCRLRAYCPACAAMALAETGSTAGLPDYACRLTEAYCAELARLGTAERNGE